MIQYPVQRTAVEYSVDQTLPSLCGSGLRGFFFTVLCKDMHDRSLGAMGQGFRSLDPRPNPRGRVWGKTLPGSVLSAGMLPSVLMRERTSLQPTSVRVRLMAGSEYTVEHRNLENWSST